MPVIRANMADLSACWDEIRSSGHFTEGKYTRLLEETVGDWYGAEAIAVSSAGAGLFAVMRCLQQDPDRTVAAVSTNTFFATGAMAKEAGWDVQLTDCNRTDFSMSEQVLCDPRQIGAVVLTHVGGALATDYRLISEACRAAGSFLVEDAAHAFGSLGPSGEKAGQYGDAAVFSLYPTKAIPAGEGGIVITKNPQLAEALRRFRNYGKYKDGDQLRYTGMGFNLRMDEWTAAVAYLQFQTREEIVTSRSYAALRLQDIIPSMHGPVPGSGSNWYKYPVMREHAEALGIKRFAGQVYAKSDQLVASMGLTHYEGQFPDADWVADNHVCLPLDEGMYDGMNKDQALAWLRGE